MASSGTVYGSFNGSSGGNFTFRAEWTVLSQDIAARTSSVRIKWIVTKTYAGQQTWKQTTPWRQTVDGSETSGTVFFDIRNIGANVDYTVITRTVTVQHGLNGAKVASLSGTLDLSGTSAGVGSFSGSMSLPTIPVTPPTIDSFTLSDAGTGVSTVGVYVASKSIIRLTASASGANGSTIERYSFYANGNLIQDGASSSYTGSQAAVAGSYVFKVVVTDSYGLTAEQSLASVTVHNYEMPKIVTETFRCDSGGNPDNLGTYVKCKLSWTIEPVGTNAVVAHQVTLNGVTTQLAAGVAQVVGAGAISPQSTYNAVYLVTDSFNSPATFVFVVLSGEYDWDFDPDGGVGFGQFAETGKLATTYDIKTTQTIRAMLGMIVEQITAPATLNDLNTSLLAIFGDMAADTIKICEAAPSASFTPFGGGKTVFLMYKASSTYGAILGMNGISSTGCALYKTSVYSSAITGWTAI